MDAAPAVPLRDELRARVHEVPVPHELDVLDPLDAGVADAVAELSELAQAGEGERVEAVEGVRADEQPSLRHQERPEEVAWLVGVRYRTTAGAYVESV